MAERVSCGVIAFLSQVHSEEADSWGIDLSLVLPFHPNLALIYLFFTEKLNFSKKQGWCLLNTYF